MGRIVRERLALQEVCYALSPFGGIHRFQTLRDRAGSSVAAQSYCLRSLNQLLDSAAQLGPVLDLSGN